MTDYSDAWAQYFNQPGSPSPQPGNRLEAKPTVHGGITFRSALEASWARTLDSLGVRWEYEPEMIALPSGENYLPDFRLPEIGAWLEVKGDNIPRIEKARELGRTLACDCNPKFTCDCRWRGGWIVIVGHPPRHRPRGGDYGHYVEYEPGEYDDEGSSEHYFPGQRAEWWMSWSGAFGGNPWFTSCRSCGVSGWTTSPACRACQKPIARGLIAAADEQIRMARP